MMGVAPLNTLLMEKEAHSALIDLLPSLIALLPPEVEFNSDQWNLLSWRNRKGNRKSYYIYFDQFRNSDLKQLIKLYLLEKRLNKLIGAGTVRVLVAQLLNLDQALGSRQLASLSDMIFLEAQELIVTKVAPSAAPRCTAYLEVFGRWLSINFGNRINYSSTLASRYMHGRKATDEARDAKLIDSRIVTDLIAANQRENLSAKDQFYLSAFAILAGTGFRIGELASLPKDCIVKESDNVGIRYFPEKKPRLDTRWLPSAYASVVEDAVSKLVASTAQGRQSARILRENPGLDWSEIIKDKNAAQYFVSKFCHLWTSDPANNMFSQEGAWLEKEKRHIDVIKLMETEGSQVKVANLLGISRPTVASLIKAQNFSLSHELSATSKSHGKKARTSWDNDSRVISIMRLENHINLSLRPEPRRLFAHIIDDARDNYQLKGKAYPLPYSDEDLERHFIRPMHPVVESKGGRALLQPEDALLITAKYQLSDTRRTKLGDFQLIDDSALIYWFAGSKRSHGTKNFEDSCFSRLGIIDPNTDTPAKFTSHDIRHWLSTFYLEGGMSSEQTALLFNRTTRNNETYDQTSSKTRLNNMREAIREGGAIGHVSDTYSKIAKYSREEAERYLKAVTLQLNLMPHGSCSLNWGMKACPHHNGCFNGAEGLCEHLCIDPNDKNTKIEINRMAQETDTALTVIPENSPQFSHYQNINRNLKKLNGGK